MTKEMLARIETMVLMGGELPVSAIRGQIASAIDIIVHLGRMRNGSRKVISIMEVSGVDERGEIRCRTLFRYDRQSGGLREEERLQNSRKLEAAGLSVLHSVADGEGYDPG